MHLLSGDNNLVPFHLWWRKIVLKSEMVYKYFVQNCKQRHNHEVSWRFGILPNSESCKIELRIMMLDHLLLTRKYL